MDRGRSVDTLGVGVGVAAAESGRHHTSLMVHKFDEDATRWSLRRLGLDRDPGIPLARFEQLRIKPYDIGYHEGNLITDAGWNLIMKNLAGTAGTLFSATVGRVGVGNGSTAVGYTDTDLSALAGSTNRQFKLISSTPTVGSTHTAGLVFTAAFGSAQANFTTAWQEFGVDQGTADGTTVVAVLLNHALSNQGIKTTGQTWTATVTITWT